jgi:hypothetical protein
MNSNTNNNTSTNVDKSVYVGNITWSYHNSPNFIEIDKINNLYNNPRWILSNISEKINDRFSHILYFDTQWIVDSYDMSLLLLISPNGDVLPPGKYSLKIMQNERTYRFSMDRIAEYFTICISDMILEYYLANDTKLHLTYKKFTLPNGNLSQGYYINPIYLPLLVLKYPMMFGIKNYTKLIETINYSSKPSNEVNIDNCHQKMISEQFKFIQKQAEIIKYQADLIGKLNNKLGN